MYIEYKHNPHMLSKKHDLVYMHIVLVGFLNRGKVYYTVLECEQKVVSCTEQLPSTAKKFYCIVKSLNNIISLWDMHTFIQLTSANPA